MNTDQTANKVDKAWHEVKVKSKLITHIQSAKSEVIDKNEAVPSSFSHSHSVNLEKQNKKDLKYKAKATGEVGEDKAE